MTNIYARSPYLIIGYPSSLPVRRYVYDITSSCDVTFQYTNSNFETQTVTFSGASTGNIVDDVIYNSSDSSVNIQQIGGTCSSGSISMSFTQTGTVESISEIELKLWIYTGPQLTSHTSTPTYTLTSTPVNSEVTFNIAPLIKDYFFHHSAGFDTKDVLWVDYKLGSSSVVQNVAFDGYGYFEDGVNPTEEYVGNEAYASMKTEIFIPENTDFEIPLNNSVTGITVSLFKDDNSLLSSYTTASTTQSDQVAYYVLGGSRVGYFDVDGTVYKVNRICEPKYTPIKLRFINKAGFYEDLWFFKNSKLSLETKEKSYRSNTLRSGSYSDYEHQYRTLYKEGKESLTINSGFYPESYNEVFRQLLLSEYVWITYNNYNLPCKIKDSSISFSE